MDILLIGNGFDLAHNLPTTYRDFLYFCDAVMTISKATDNSLALLKLQHIYEQWTVPTSIRTQLQGALFCQFGSHYSDLCDPAARNAVNSVYSCIHDNLWIHYFKNRLSFLGSNWIDFEKEISNVIQMLDTTKVVLNEHSNIRQLSVKDKANIGTISDAFGKNSYDFCCTMDALGDTRNTLSHDLDRLTHALEIYLAAFVNCIPISRRDINKDALILPDKVLSFNYTNTHERIFEQVIRTPEYCYIHGKARDDNTTESCNMVLGIDEYLTDNRKNSDLEFLHFKKYYQRIYKGTDNSYLNWIDVIRGYPQDTHSLSFFGHSLDVTDKDILHQFICNDNVHTKIFYHRKHEHDKSVLGQLIHNLVRIIGQDELIRRTGGTHKTIEFIPQALTAPGVEEK